MSAFLIRSNLTKDDLTLYLHNVNGYPTDAFSVRWTVYSNDGIQISGKNLPAINAEVGKYYAPWFANTHNGNYRVEWEIQPESGFPIQKVVDKFFVLDPSSYQCCPTICKDGYPVPGGQVYLTGSTLGPGDLPLYLKDSSGFSVNAFAVFWTIQRPDGCCITHRAVAINVAPGEYYADWHVFTPSGDYIVKWEFMQDADSPLESKSQGFSVINSGYCSPRICGCRINYCVTAPLCTFTNPPINVVPTNPSCCVMNIPRTIHLAYLPLPPGGQFTNHEAYDIPNFIMNITFYVTYKRGAPGGFASLRLFWGNGVEETQETIIDSDFDATPPNAVQNMYLQSLDSPIPLDEIPITFPIYSTIPGGATTARLIAREEGIVGAPGLLGITLTASS